MQKMENIKHLPKSVHSSLRSSVILFDLPRVVEELICNSVDACATKIFVSVSVAACYVKVEDDGCGITRDGLVILGERHASSKLDCLTGMETDIESLGFRGEALGSLSDISLVEVRTKARGKPNAYCKIIKGWKCLFLGIDNQREAVGTTVVVRDLFYNQPVRRKYMHSSHKNVLLSVKKCVLRTALVRPQISFRVMDIESGDELFCTIPSPSPLRLVSDSFGNEVSSSLHEISFADQVMKLSGYLSGPSDAFSTKAFQYLYINSRFVCKGPIHNLLNDLAASLQCSLALQRVEPQINSGKRQRTQGYPAYMLNLCCPLSSYDLTFELSKTLVEFKDWSPVLAFFGQAIENFWKELLAKSLGGKTCSPEDSKPMERNFGDGSERIESEIQGEGMSKGSKIRKGKHNVQFYQNSPIHDPATKSLDISSEAMNVDHKHGKSPRELSIFFPELKPCQRKTGRAPLDDQFFHDVLHGEQRAFVSADGQIGFTKTVPQYFRHDSGSFLAEDQFFSQCEVNEKYGMSGLACKNDSPEGDRSFNTGSTHSTVRPDPYGIIDNAQDIQFPLVCQSFLCKPGKKSNSLMETEQVNLLGGDFSHSRECFSCSDGADANGACYSQGILNFGMSPLQEHAGASMPSFSALKESCGTGNFDSPLDHLLHHCSHDRVCGSKGHTLYKELANQVWESGFDYVSTKAKWFLSSPHAMVGKSLAKVDGVAPMYESDGNSRFIKNLLCRKYGSEESNNDFPEFFNIEEDGFHEVFPDRSSKKAKLGHKYWSSFKENMCGEWHLDGIIHRNVCSSSKLNDETGSMRFNTTNVGDKDKYLPICVQSHYKVGERHRNKQRYRDCHLSHQPMVRSRRSCSAPPFYKGKSRYSILNDHLTKIDRKETSFQLMHDTKNSPENSCPLNELSQPCNSMESYPEAAFDEASQPSLRECTGAKTVRQETNGAQNNKKCKNACSNRIPNANALEDFVIDKMECASVALTKWRDCNVQPTGVDMPHNKLDHQDEILDISSGFLHLAGGSLVPERINKDFLEDARVLLQLDKKFIPVMARGVLVIVDQHAADERIRLEELRRQVISGEGCSITYLGTEQDLVLPEEGLQLLQNYTEQIHKWGWICSIQRQCSESFAKNMNYLKSQSYGVTLVAFMVIFVDVPGCVYLDAAYNKVPCILGINLTDKDLIEFLEQLSETDGSSTLPPAVLRILNFKACRGAIMFGDPLLPSECSLIVEELKSTSLCFQCAHGRPTAVPLLDMASLHEQISRLELRMARPAETWHGLCRHRPSIARAQQRLASAKRFHNG